MIPTLWQSKKNYFEFKLIDKACNSNVQHNLTMKMSILLLKI